jgi:hypothetical protein
MTRPASNSPPTLEYSAGRLGRRNKRWSISVPVMTALLLYAGLRWAQPAYVAEDLIWLVCMLVPLPLAVVGLAVRDRVLLWMSVATSLAVFAASFAMP